MIEIHLNNSTYITYIEYKVIRLLRKFIPQFLLPSKPLS